LALWPSFGTVQAFNKKSGEAMNRLSRLALQASFGALLFAAVWLLVAQSNIRRISGQSGCNSLDVVSAASFIKKLAPESIAAGFGENLATRVEEAPTQPLPTRLAGTEVKVKDSAGAERLAPLFYVSPKQVNFLIPAGTALGAATITVTSGDGKCSTTTASITKAAPGLFTANAGVPAAYVVRVKPDGTRTTEQRVSPLSLGPEGEEVHLILFGTGIRGRNALADVTVQIGSKKVNVSFAGAQPGSAGLDQVNVGPVLRSLLGRGKVNIALTINGFGSANLTGIEIAGAGGATPPRISSFTPTTALAGETLTISGEGFGTDNLVRIGDTEARVESAKPTELVVRVPFGAETAPIYVRTSGGEVRSADSLMVRTSISGYVEDTARQPLKDVTVSVPGVSHTVRTDADGSFVFPDPLPPGVTVDNRLPVKIDGSTVTAPGPYYPVWTSLETHVGRDNQLSAIALQQAIGPAIPVGSSPTLSDDAPALSLKTAIPLAPDQAGRAGLVIFEVQPGTTARFPNGATSGNLNLTVIENQRTPVKLPPNIFSSAIVQITEFNVSLNPGGKLTFPNTDRLPAGTQLTLYRLDQRRGSQTLGQFIGSGRATVTADGQWIETMPNAITETSIYFVAAERPATTVTGRVLDSDGSPVRRARIWCRGQEDFTDGNGGYVLFNVPGIPLNIAASFQRANRRVDRTRRNDVPAVVNGVTIVDDLILPPETSSRPPVILVPTDLTVAEGETRSIDFDASDPDPGQRVVSVVIEPSLPFVTLRQIGNDRWNLQITPGPNQAGTYNLTLKATDDSGDPGGVLSLPIRLRVNRPPVANPQTVTLDEDTSKQIRLTGNDPGGLPLNYIIVSRPRSGRLSDAAPSLTYTPDLNYNGMDSFTFRVNNGFSDSQPATVSILINPVNDAPVLTVPGPQSVDEGRELTFTISATDVDAGQTLTFTAENLPAGASFTQTGGTTARFVWTPSNTQAGNYMVRFRVTDNGAPALSDTKTVAITVRDVANPLAQTSGPECGQINALVSNGADLFAANYGGVFRSTDQGQSWTAVNNGFREDLYIRSLVVSGAGLFASARDNIFRSTNNGQSWMVVSDMGADRLFANGSDLFAFTGRGFLRSTDDGRSWTPANNGLPDLLVTSLAAIGANLFAGVSDSGVFVSTDNGQSWTAINAGLPGLKVRSLVVSGANIFAGIDGGVFRLASDGQNWEDANVGLPPNPFISSFAVSGQNLFVGIASPGAESGVFVSTNNGQSWEARNNGLTNRFVNALIVSGAYLFAGAEGGVFVSSNNGQNWTAANACQ
jgi:uncharacterized protein (TIGR03437 family)